MKLANTEKNFLNFCKERKITLSAGKTEQRLPAHPVAPEKAFAYPQRGFAPAEEAD